MHRGTESFITAVTIVIFAVTGASAQDPAGTVTAVQGHVTVARATTTPTELRFRDDIFVRDRLSAADRSLARILLGGKAVPTVGERSVVTITESPGLSVIDLASGKIALVVAKERMVPGERIDIRTPNAVAGIRGTVVIAEVSGPRGGGGQPSAADTSRITVLHGVVEVSAFDARAQQPAGPPVRVGALQSVTIDARGPSEAVTMTPTAAHALSDQFKIAPRDESSATQSVATEAQVKHAVDHVAALLRAGRDAEGQPQPASSHGNAGGKDGKPLSTTSALSGSHANTTAVTLLGTTSSAQPTLLQRLAAPLVAKTNASPTLSPLQPAAGTPLGATSPSQPNLLQGILTPRTTALPAVSPPLR